MRARESEHPADAQSGKRDLGEAAQQDDVAAIGGLLDGRQILARIAQIAVYIVFDQRHARGLDGVEEGGARGDGHGRAGRILEVGSDHDQAGAFAMEYGLEPIDVHAVRANRNSDELRAGFEEETLESRVDGIFDDHFVAGAEEHAAEQVERLLTAVGDD